ncbi:MAG: Gx transporter family protein [Clostridium sp.]|uniref:Gx transporter family protein n=1 Tax=Clostridium sp. TaxID=1506 RepID=UPI003EE72E15
MVNQNTSKLIYMSLLISLSLILFTVERAIPAPLPVPGAKIGLSNLIIMISIYTLSPKDSFIVLSLKIVLSCIFGGGLSTFLYSFTGGLLSFSSTMLLKICLKDKVSLVGVSVASAFFHNLGQILVASLILESSSIFLYLPLLGILGILTGFFIGLSSNYVLLHLKKLRLYS